MARPRTLSQMREQAYRDADVEGADDRHDQDEVDRDLNAGAAEFWDEFIAANGAGAVQADEPFEITTTQDEVTYDLPSDYYVLVQVRVDGVPGGPLTPFDDHEEAELRQDTSSGVPTHYQIRRSVQMPDADANTTTGTARQVIDLLPAPAADKTVIVKYAPHAPELTEDDDVLDGLNGWEEYAIKYAARELASRDDEDGLYAKHDKRLAELRARIHRMAPKRDQHQARRVRDVRGPKMIRTRFPPA